MNSIFKVSDINNLDSENLVLIDDEHGGFNLGIKSDKAFDNIDFKFKKLQFKDISCGVFLIKSNNNFYSRFVDMGEKSNIIGIFLFNSSDILLNIKLSLEYAISQIIIFCSPFSLIIIITI